MKKLLLVALLVFSLGANAQSDYYTVISGLGTSQNGRAPQGGTRYNRSVWLITAAEMTAVGFTSGSVINALGFNLSVAQNIATTGNYTVYLQNTADATNTKSTAWATAITGMAMVNNSTLTIPAAVGTFDTTFIGGSVFTYTGGALYIAFDYQNALGAIATVPNTALCNTLLTAGLKGAINATAAPATLTVSNFRPETRLGIEVLCARPDALGASNSTINSVDLTWISAGPVEIEYGPYGFAPGTGTIITGVNTPYTLAGLLPSTAYDYYARKDCGGGNFSSWNGPFAFNTVFQPATPTYNTGFEVDDFPLIGWKADPETNGSNWFINYGGTGSALVQNGQFSAVSISNTIAATAARMYSRGITLQAGTPATVTYYARNYVATSTNTSNYQLTVGTAQTAAGQTTVVGSEAALSSTTFALKTFNYTPPTTGTYYFAFLNSSALNTAGTHALIIDNFTVTQPLATTQFSASNFSISPNPASSVINIDSKLNSPISAVSLTDLNGRTVKQIKFDNLSKVQINISDLSTGVYMMNITSKEGTAKAKIIKS